MNLKEKTLTEILRGFGKVAVALSGGLDSGALLHFAASALGAENCAALTADTPQMPRAEMGDSERLCAAAGVARRAVKSAEIPEAIRENPPDRCYLCKRGIFSEFARICREESFGTLCDGTNADDLSDFRPGMRALRELGVRSPLLEAGWGKADILEYARENMPRFAPSPSNACLMTRFEAGARVSESALRAVDAAEEFVRSLGFSRVRVRVHGKRARVELGAGELGRFFARAGELAPAVAERLKSLGFESVSVDLNGYSMGNMNR